MLSTRFLADRIWQKVTGPQTKLSCHEPGDRLRDYRASLQQTLWITKGAQLKRKTDLILRTSTCANVVDIVIGYRYASVLTPYLWEDQKARNVVAS